MTWAAQVERDGPLDSALALRREFLRRMRTQRPDAEADEEGTALQLAGSLLEDSAKICARNAPSRRCCSPIPMICACRIAGPAPTR